MAVFSFLEGFDAAGKRILPFCTHEGSAMGNSERDIRKACPEAKVLPGLAIQGGHITHADGVIAQWVGGGN